MPYLVSNLLSTLCHQTSYMRFGTQFKRLLSSLVYSNSKMYLGRHDDTLAERILQKGNNLSKEAMLARSKVKKKFDNLLGKNEPWVRLNQRYGLDS